MSISVTLKCTPLDLPLVAHYTNTGAGRSGGCTRGHTDIHSDEVEWRHRCQCSGHHPRGAAFPANDARGAQGGSWHGAGLMRAPSGPGPTAWLGRQDTGQAQECSLPEAGLDLAVIQMPAPEAKAPGEDVGQRLLRITGQHGRTRPRVLHCAHEASLDVVQ